ncbi:MAG TPA: hypothetical protein VFB07_08685 [Vicinamibacterales bacterium]|nr:hypothetical protein [Vicinamibacterales bacterium]
MVVAAIAIASASTAAAQPPDGRVEVGVGAGWIGSAAMSAVEATETQGNNTARTVFGFSRELASTPVVEARVAVRLSTRLDVEATGSYARPQLRVTTADDVEGAAAVTADEQLQEFTVGGAASWFLVRRAAQTRTTPFVTAGAAYVRQLHQAATLADAGALVDLGGGLERVLRVREGRVRSIGLRIDAHARVRPKAVAVDGRTHVAPMISASLFVRF